MNKKKIYKSDYVVHSLKSDFKEYLTLPTIIVSADPGVNGFAVLIVCRNRSNVEMCSMEVKSLSRKKKDSENDYKCSSLVSYLDTMEKWWESVSYVILEKQMKDTTLAVYYQALSYFIIKCPQAVIVTVSPKLKGRMLDAPKNLNNKGLKDWAIEKFEELCEERNDETSRITMENKKGRKHDMADCAVQEEAFYQLLKIRHE